jgi:hypothetical protein
MSRRDGSERETHVYSGNLMLMAAVIVRKPYKRQ